MVYKAPYKLTLGTVAKKTELSYDQNRLLERQMQRTMDNKGI